ncbi:MAG: TIM barrel protein [Phycisphaeraceae bacterium]|nr:TIM barrel protein [Phycisphaeraceae bacterium]
MSILTPGSDMRLAPMVRTLAKQTDGTVRGALDSLRQSGFTAVQLDATFAGIRPRDLDHRSRRDLLALLGRHGIQLAGLDLFVPRRHWVESEHVDRATSAALAAIQLAADLGRVPVSLSLPVEAFRSSPITTMLEAADACNVPLAVHAEDKVDDLLAWLDEVDQPMLGAAVDAATLLAWGQQPDKVVHRLSKRLLVGRLSDLQRGGDEDLAQAGGVRCTVGEGELSVLTYRLALELCARRYGPVVLDLRGMEDAPASSAAAMKAWNAAGLPG